MRSQARRWRGRRRPPRTSSRPALGRCRPLFHSPAPESMQQTSENQHRLTARARVEKPWSGPNAHGDPPCLRGRRRRQPLTPLHLLHRLISSDRAQIGSCSRRRESSRVAAPGASPPRRARPSASAKPHLARPARCTSPREDEQLGGALPCPLPPSSMAGHCRRHRQRRRPGEHGGEGLFARV